MPQTARDPEGRDMSVVDRNLVQVLDELERESALSQYVQVLWRRRWIILATVIAGLLIALIISWSTVRLYRATTSLQISREAEQVVDVKGVE
ncbi:MAG TPA: Wzz/FepE/Etk N-terminal domain-containing protein, partial [Chakrabartia sp.]|nr:Wzz/FepE/Etk N-terminal domain-containing protein [Chakrabartia sp.]